MRAVLELPSFRRLALAYGVNAIGNWLAEIALVILVYRSTGSVLPVVVLMVAGQLAPALFAPLALSKLELRGGRRTLSLLHLLEACLLAMLSFSAAAAPLALIVAVVFADGVLGLAARTLVKAAVVSVTQPRGLLRDANAVLNLAFTLSAAAGPALAGWLTATAGVEVALLLDASSFVFAAAALAAQGPINARGDRRRPGSSDRRCLAHLRLGLAHVREQLLLRRLVLADALLCALLAMILPIEVVYLTDTLHGGPGALGVVLTAWGVGSVGGGLLLARLPQVPLQLMMLAGMFAMLTAYIGMAAVGSVTAVAAFSALGGIGNGIEAFSSLTVIQLATGEQFQARVSALVESIHAGAPGIGFVLGGGVAVLASPRMVYVIAGAGALGVALWSAGVLRDAKWPQPAVGSVQ